MGTNEGTEFCGTNYKGRIELSCQDGKVIMKMFVCHTNSCQQCEHSQSTTFEQSEFAKIGTGDCYSMKLRHSDDTMGIEIADVSSKTTGVSFSNPCTSESTSADATT